MLFVGCRRQVDFVSDATFVALRWASQDMYRFHSCLKNEKLISLPNIITIHPLAYSQHTRHHALLPQPYQSTACITLQPYHNQTSQQQHQRQSQHLNVLLQPPQSMVGPLQLVDHHMVYLLC